MRINFYALSMQGFTEDSHGPLLEKPLIKKSNVFYRLMNTEMNLIIKHGAEARQRERFGVASNLRRKNRFAATL